jgi:hypothetical protein
MGCFNGAGDWGSSGVSGVAGGGTVNGGPQTSLSVLTTVWGVTSTTQSGPTSYNAGANHNSYMSNQHGSMGCPPYGQNAVNKGVYNANHNPNNGPVPNAGHMNNMTNYRHNGPPA